jgi:hypothetical protein
VFVLSLLRFPKPWGLDCVVFLVPLESFQSVGGAPSDLVTMSGRFLYECVLLREGHLRVFPNLRRTHDKRLCFICCV